MPDLGFPIEIRREAIDDYATALHAACWAGSAETVALLLERGADLTVRDTRWQSAPLGWAFEGSGDPDSAAPPDWIKTVTMLLHAGASLEGITLDQGDSKHPSTALLEPIRSRRLAGDMA